MRLLCSRTIYGTFMLEEEEETERRRRRRSLPADDAADDVLDRMAQCQVLRANVGRALRNAPERLRSAPIAPALATSRQKTPGRSVRRWVSGWCPAAPRTPQPRPQVRPRDTFPVKPGVCRPCSQPLITHSVTHPVGIAMLAVIESQGGEPPRRVRHEILATSIRSAWRVCSAQLSHYSSSTPDLAPLEQQFAETAAESCLGTNKDAVS